MKREEQTIPIYEAPKVEIVNVEIEKGFAVSVYVNDWEDGSSLGTGNL